MIDKPDPAKGAATQEGSGVKRPHATLDLKATEVKQPPKSAPSKSAQPSSSSPGSSPLSEKTSADPKSPGSKVPPAEDAASKASAARSSASPSQSGKPPSSASAKPEAASERTQRRGRGGVFSHLASGVVGGALAYTGAVLLAPGGGVTPSPTDIEARLVTVESALRESADLSAKLAAAENRLTSLETIEQRVTALGDAQSQLQAETRQLAEGSGAANAERLQKLEEQLALIADGADNANGGIPELAAITGKIAELDKTLNARVQALNDRLPPEADTRIASALDASETARSTAVRLERELAEVRSGQSAATQNAEAAKDDVQRLSESFVGARRETDRLQSAVSELRASLETGLKGVARPGDVTAALGPVTSKIAELEQNLASVVAREESQRENAERIVLALELANLKRAIDRGQGHGYVAELAAVEKSAGEDLDLSALARFKETGVATPAELKASFRPVMNAVIDAEAEPKSGSVFDRLMAGAKSVVRVRKVHHDAGDTSAEAVVSRIEAALDAGRLGDVIAEANGLSPMARAPMEDWLIKVTARDSVDRAIARVEDRLKAALADAPDPTPAAMPDVAPEAAHQEMGPQGTAPREAAPEADAASEAPPSTATPESN